MLMTEQLPPSTADAEAAPASLAERLEHAAAHVAANNVTVGELFNELGKGSPYLLMALLAIPFAHPLPTWGLSTPFGLAILLMAIGAIRNERTHQMPDWISKKKVHPKVSGVLKLSAVLSRFFERLMKPRWKWALWHPMLALPAIGLSGLLLMLPLPIPFTNLTAGLSAVLISLGMLYRDGLAMMFAALSFWLMVAFYGAIAWYGPQVIMKVIGAIF